MQQDYGFDGTHNRMPEKEFERSDALGILGVIGAVAVAVALASGTGRAPSHAGARLATVEAPAGVFDPSPFVLNALLVPALDADADPLRFGDPVFAANCAPGTTVTVNGEPVVAGAPVPVKPFELAWTADDCRPFGVQGPSFDGRVNLSVFREDWGFSAIVDTSDVDGLVVTLPNNSHFVIRQRWASLPQNIDSEQHAAALGD